jgi:hypothetical protein
MRRWPWLLAAVLLVGATIAGLWLLRPTYGYCIEAGPHAGCGDGVFSLAAVIGTIGLAALLVVYVALVITTRGPRILHVRVIGLAALVVAAIAAFALLGAPLEQIPLS